MSPRRLPLLLFLCLVLAGCGSAQTLQSALADAAPEAPSWTAAEIRAAVFPDTVRPGEPFVAAVAVPSAAAATAAANAAARPRAEFISPKGNRIAGADAFVLESAGAGGTVWAAVMAVPSTSAWGAAVVRITGIGGAAIELPFTVSPREFSTENLVLTGAMSDILTKPDPEKTRQSQELAAILAATGDTLYSGGDFVMPVVTEKTTSPYGGRRVNRYPNGKTSTAIHAGIDYRAREGTPITVCGRGRVVFAGFRIVTGNTVIIEHMPGVYSLCYHLSKIFVTAGMSVEPGDPLGEAGATGFATGAHLHWEVRVSGENADPESFLGRTILDKDAILGTLVVR
jgi:murein DD-endopeptidase MepM/ murein hydrolase activator NlpD